MIQRESITVEFGKVLSKDYNSIKMTIKESYLVSGEEDFNTKDFIMTKCHEFEQIIDEKLQPQNKVAPLKEEDSKTVQRKYPQTASIEPKHKKGHCQFCGTKLEKAWYHTCVDCWKKNQ